MCEALKGKTMNESNPTVEFLIRLRKIDKQGITLRQHLGRRQRHGAETVRTDRFLALQQGGKPGKIVAPRIARHMGIDQDPRLGPEPDRIGRDGKPRQTVQGRNLGLWQIGKQRCLPAGRRDPAPRQ